MAGFAVGTAGGLKQADASALMQRLKQSAPAQNPGTSANRMDTTTERLVACNQVRVSLEKLMTTINDDEDLLKSLVVGMHATINQILAGVEPQQILQMLQQKLGATKPPMPPAPQMGPTAGMPTGAAPGPQIPGMPPSGAPVSPGSLPGQQ